MQPLISTTSRLYACRLIREIRDRWQRGHGVYYCGSDRPTNPRLNSVRYNVKRHCIIAESNAGQLLILPAEWDYCFVDNATGSEVFASRRTTSQDA
jgi:hypothetical protein